MLAAGCLQTLQNAEDFPHLMSAARQNCVSLLVNGLQRLSFVWRYLDGDAGAFLLVVGGCYWYFYCAVGACIVGAFAGLLVGIIWACAVGACIVGVVLGAQESVAAGGEVEETSGSHSQQQTTLLLCPCLCFAFYNNARRSSRQFCCPACA